MMQVDLDVVEDAARELYVRALKVLPPDVKAGFARVPRARLGAAPSHARHHGANIGVAEGPTTYCARTPACRSTT